MGVVVLAVV